MSKKNSKSRSSRQNHRCSTKSEKLFRVIQRLSIGPTNHRYHSIINSSCQSRSNE